MQTCRQTSGCENRSWKNKKNLLSCSLGRLSNCWQRCFPYIKKKINKNHRFTFKCHQIWHPHPSWSPHGLSVCVLQVSRLVVPIHGAPQSSLPALEDGDVLPVWAAGALLVCTSGQKLIVCTLQLFQLLARPPETCVQHRHKYKCRI